MLAVSMALAGCSDWANLQDVEFDDPYVANLSESEDGWLDRLGLFRRYAAVDRAFRLEAEGDYAAAAAEVEGYLDLHPDDTRVRAYYLTLLDRTGSNARLIEEASILLEQHPEYVPALIGRGRALAEQGRLEAAVDDLLAASRASSVQPADRAAALDDAARHTLARAASLEEQGRLGDAAAAYAAALELPLDTDRRIRALRGRSRTAVARGQIEAARTAVGQAVAVAPRSVGLRLEAAGLALRAGDHRDAVTHLEALLTLEDLEASERLAALDQLAVAYERLGTPAAAAERVEELIRRRPAGPGRLGLHLRAATLHEAAGRSIRAAGHLESAAGLAGTGGRVAHLRRAAALYTDRARYDDAVDALRAALATAPRDDATRDQLSEVLILAARPDADAERLGRLRQELADSPLTAEELAASRRSFARAYESVGQLAEARELWARIAETEPPGSPGWVEAVERQAALAARLDEPRRAADLLMQLHRTAPDEPAAREGRWALEAAERYAAAGVWPDAAAAYREALGHGALTGVDGARRLGVALVEADAGYEAAQVLSAIPAEERTLQDYRYLARLAAEARDTARALELYADGLSAAPTAEDSARTLRAMGYLTLTRDDSAAVGFLARSLALEPDPGVRTDLARAHLRLDRPDAALEVLGALPEEVPTDRQLDRLDLLAEIHAERGDTAAVIEVLEAAAALEPTAYRFNRLGFFYELVDRYRPAAAAFERAYDDHPSAVQAAQVAYAYRRVGEDSRATDWFRRSIDAAREGRGDTVDLDALRREVAALTDRLSAAFYSSFRGEGAAAAPSGAVAQAGIGSQGGFQLLYRPLLGRTSWGRDIDVFGRLFWGYADGLGIESDSYQGHLGIRYRPPLLPGSAIGLERWVGLGSAGLDAWAARIQLSELLGRPYPEPGEGPAAYAALYGDAAWLMDRGGYLAFGEARPGLAVPLGERWALLPHGAVSVYHQSLDGLERSYFEGGPGFGLRLRVPRDRRYTRSFWTAELLTQYRWGRITGTGAPDGSYGELVLTLVLQL